MLLLIIDFFELGFDLGDELLTFANFPLLYIDLAELVVELEILGLVEEQGSHD